MVPLAAFTVLLIAAALRWGASSTRFSMAVLFSGVAVVAAILLAPRPGGEDDPYLTIIAGYAIIAIAGVSLFAFAVATLFGWVSDPDKQARERAVRKAGNEKRRLYTSRWARIEDSARQVRCGRCELMYYRVEPVCPRCTGVDDVRVRVAKARTWRARMDLARIMWVGFVFWIVGTGIVLTILD